MSWAAALPELWTPQAVEQSRAPRRYLPGAPEIYFAKPIDNSRLVRKMDQEQHRDLLRFTVAVSILLLLVFFYLWQHFSSIEYGYKIEALRSQREQLIDVNKTLKLEQASLRDPERIDAIARSLGMQMPIAGQVQRMEPSSSDIGGPVMARAAGVSVISLPQ